MVTHPSILAWRIPGAGYRQYTVRGGHKELDTTEWQTHKTNTAIYKECLTEKQMVMATPGNNILYVCTKQVEECVYDSSL